MRNAVLTFIFFTFSFALGPWATMTGQVHSELNWKTIQTEHYRVHYHDGIEDIAQQGASIAEQVYPILIKQVGIETTPMIDIIFTTEDEIMNGYAMWTNQTFIWVDQNDAAIWLENGKWLYQVLSHELQHIMYFNAVKTWMPEPFSSMFSDTPGWFVEGLAEYFTEKYSLPFTLLSDTKGEVSKVYDAAGWFMPKRYTYIIDPNGKIVNVYTKFDISAHSTEIISFIKSLLIANPQATLN